MITFEDAVRSVQDQALSAFTSWQQGSIEALHAWVKAMAPLMPDMNLYHELPTFMQDALGDPERILERTYQFGLAIMKLQQEYVLEVYRASMVAPRTPMVPRYTGDK